MRTLITVALLLGGSAQADQNSPFMGNAWDNLVFRGEPEQLSIVPTQQGYAGRPLVPEDFEFVSSGGSRRGYEPGYWYQAYVYRHGGDYLVEVWAQDAGGKPQWARRYHAASQN